MLGSNVRRFALVAALFLALGACGPAGQAQDDFKPQVGQAGKDVIWVPTPDALVQEMLALAEVTANDVVVDLGAGDGKIAIAAARDFGARARGVEFNPKMVALAQRNAQAAGVAQRATILEGDIFTHDFTDATVVTMYLLPTLNMRLRPQLLDLRPGTRIVSHAFDLGDWAPDGEAEADGARAYLWIVPAAVAGDWRFESAAFARPMTVSFAQQFQQVTVDGGAAVGEVALRGPSLSFAASPPGRPRVVVRGTVKGDQFIGEAIPEGEAPQPITGARLTARAPLHESAIAVDVTPAVAD